MATFKSFKLANSGMASMRALGSVAWRNASTCTGRRLLHQSYARRAITNLQMPAMSPTMTEGGISSWKKKEGEAFAAGDVLLEIETDKATIDVEAQEDGVMGKILLADGSKGVPVGKVIALLAEEGDDIANLEAPKEEAPAPKKEESTASSSSAPSPVPGKPTSPEASAPTPPQSQPTAHVSHSRPLFPSVHRLLAEHNIANADQIKGTGIRGMLTKGDVLAFLGKASGPLGTYNPGPALPQEIINGQKAAPKKEEVKALDGPALRRLIVSTMLQKSIAARSAPASRPAPDFDSIIADYLPKSTPAPAKPASVPAASKSKASPDFLDGLY